MKISDCENYLLDDSGNRVAEFVESFAICNGCYLERDLTTICNVDHKCTDQERKDNKNGYWKKL